MAKRLGDLGDWAAKVGKTLLGTVLVCLTPMAAQDAQAQTPMDPVPIARTGAVGPTGGGYPGYGPAQALPPALLGPAPMPPNVAVPYGPGPMNSGCETGDQEGDWRTWNFFGGVGWVGLFRQDLGKGPFGVYSLLPGDGNGFPPPGSPEALNFRDLETQMHSGVRAAFGWYCEDAVFEASGFYIPEQDIDAGVVALAGLSSLFFNAPAAFGGTAGLFNQADSLQMVFRHTLANSELNYRWSTGADGAGIELLIGFRYVDLQERLLLITDDEFGSPLTRATYTTRTHNYLLAGQVGFGLHCNLHECLALSWEAKGGWGMNRGNIDVTLVRGDGLVGVEGHQHDWDFAHLYDTGLFLDCFVGAFRLRAGYNCMWVVNVAEAVDQVDFNLANSRGKGDYHGNVFYHGPMVLLDLMF